MFCMWLVFRTQFYKILKMAANPIHKKRSGDHNDVLEINDIPFYLECDITKKIIKNNILGNNEILHTQ